MTADITAITNLAKKQNDEKWMDHLSPSEQL